MSTTKTTEKSNKENKQNDSTGLNKRKRIKPQPIAAVKPSIADKIKQLDKQGFDYDRIAAMLMCQKSLVKQVLK
tara:strand:+ start:69 stop:290 length:222 start_codon:yes stop_codon:yes gene_type:complete